MKFESVKEKLSVLNSFRGLRWLNGEEHLLYFSGIRYSSKHPSQAF